MGDFNIKKTCLEGLYIIEPKVFEDNRGFFMETYNHNDFSRMGVDCDFVQDNHSRSVKGVLRGLHYQNKHPQTKLVRVLNGAVFDVAVDLRLSSPTYGRWFGMVLSSENKKQLLIPKGFAHGFLVLSEIAEFAYKCDDYYHPEDEDGIIYNDPDIGIDWPEMTNYILSDKDISHKRLKDKNIAF